MMEVQGRRRKGRPTLKWLDCINVNLREKGLLGKEAQDREMMQTKKKTISRRHISKQKNATERTKKRKKLELVFFTPIGGATGTVVLRLDAQRILPELRLPGISLSRALRGPD